MEISISTLEQGICLRIAEWVQRRIKSGQTWFDGFVGSDHKFTRISGTVRCTTEWDVMRSIGLIERKSGE